MAANGHRKSRRLQPCPVVSGERCPLLDTTYKPCPVLDTSGQSLDTTGQPSRGSKADLQSPTGEQNQSLTQGGAQAMVVALA